jgi:hypothetical protein
MSKPSVWNPAKIRQAIAILKRYRADEWKNALQEIQKLVPSTTRNGLYQAFHRAEVNSPFSFMRAPLSVALPEQIGSEDPYQTKILQILNARKSATFEALCDATDLSPKRLRGVIQGLKLRGVKIADVHGALEFARKNEITTVQKTGVAKVIGRRAVAGVISDLHYGSLYCHMEWITDCVEWLYGKGVREIYCPGDFLTGNYKHSMYELVAVGLQDQTKLSFEKLPRLRGLNYRLITGNHDDTFSDAIGLDTGEYIETYFRQHGRTDVHAYGRRGAFIEAQGVVVHLWHPRGSNPYAKTYELQKKVESYTPGQKPNILLAGHRHFFAYTCERGVHAFACPTFEGAGSPFGNSLKSQPQFGGMLLGWELTRDGTLRNFSHELHSYYENERPKKLRA